MPESRFAPARFQARRRSLPRIRAAIAVVVVLLIHGGDERNPEREPGRERVDSIGICLPEELSGERRAAAPARRAR